MTLRDLVVAVGFKVDKNSFGAAENSIKSLASTATKLLGAIGIALSLRSMNALAEQFNQINDSIRGATRGMGDQAEIQQKILQAANDTKTSYGTMANNVNQLIKMNKELFNTVDKASDFATSFTKALAGAGRTEGEINGAMGYMNRVFAAGKLEVTTYTRMLRQYPEILNTVADGLGVTQEELKKLANSGRISSEVIVNAFSKAHDSIQANFDELDYSISDALVNIRNSWGLFCDSLWTGSNITNGVGKMMVEVFNKILGALRKLQPYLEKSIKWILGKVRDGINFIEKISKYVDIAIKRMGGFEQAVRTLGIAFVTAFAITKFNRIIDTITKIKKLLNPTLIAILAIALLVEDFIQFMLGNDSVIGDILTKAGVDTEKFRKNIKKTWENIKSATEALMRGLKKTIIPAFEKISAVVTPIIEGVVSGLDKVFSWLSKDIDTEDWEHFGEVLGNLALIIGGVLLVMKAISIAQTIWNAVTIIAKGVQLAFIAVQNILNAALWASPITWIIAGIVALIAVVVLLIHYWDEIKAGFENAWNAICDVWNTVADWFTENIIDPIGDAIDSVIGWFKSIPDSLGEIWDKISGFFSGLIDSALEWGSDLISGFVDGILGGVEWVKDAVKGIGEKISSFLHFSEPDEGPLSNFHTWMPDMMKGLKMGITDNQGIVLESVRDLAGGISDLMQGATAAGKVASLMNTGNNRTFTQNVTFNNSYSGNNTDVIKSVAATTKKSAVDATTLMARSMAL